MKLKNILLSGLSLVLVAALAIGGTVAYLQDDDSDVNVMTLGNVKIEQHEQDRNGNDFVQGQTLLPYVTLGATVKEPVVVNGYEIQMRTKESVGNYMDKIVTVTNTGKTDAYVRTLIAIPAALENADASKNIIHWNAVSDTDTTPNNGWMWDIDNGNEWGAPVYATIEVEGVKYNVYVATNKNVIKAGESTAPSLVGIYLDSKVDSDGDKYTYDGQPIDYDFSNGVTILVMSQAVQAAGFTDADTALDTAFGTPAAKAAEWFDGIVIPVISSETDVVDNVLAQGGKILLDSNIGGEGYTPAVSAGATVSVNMKGNTVDADYFNNSGDLTLENGILESGTANDYGFIARPGSNTVLNNVEFNSAGGGIGATDGSYVEINGGHIDVSTTSTSGRYNVYAVGEGTKVVINDGTFTFSKTLNQKRAYIYASEGTTVIVNGGTFGPASTRDGYTAGILGEGTVIIKGGTFGFNPSAWVADGYEAVQSGNTWTVVAK